MAFTLTNRLSIPGYALDYLYFLEEKGRQPSTIQRYYYDLQVFFKWLTEEEGHEVTFEEWRGLDNAVYKKYLEYMKDRRKCNARTLHRIFTVLKRMAIYYTSIQKKATIPEVNESLLEAQGKQLTDKDFISKEEFADLERSIRSTAYLTPKQLKSHHLMVDRNLTIIYLMYYEGLTLQELLSIDMEDMNFIRGLIDVKGKDGKIRTIETEQWRKAVYLKYYKTIPEPVRPRYHTSDPYICAFHFNLGTYHYEFTDELVPVQPKRLTSIGLQRMLQKEMKRADIRKGIACQHFRNACILRAIRNQEETESIIKRFGFKKEQSLDRYYKYAEDKSI